MDSKGNKEAGIFHGAAKKAGDGVQEFAGKVSANPDKYSSRQAEGRRWQGLYRK